MIKVFDRILLTRHRTANLHIEELSDDFVVLMAGEERVIAYFGQKATVEEIHKEADKFLLEADAWK
jgi:hypothetical protein